MTDPYDLPEDEPEVAQAKGQRRKKKPATVFVDPDLDDCPVIPLGYDGRDVIFALPGGELRQEPAKNIPGMLKTDIFVCFDGQQFLGHWVDPSDGEFRAQACAIWFNRACRNAGKWDRNRAVRGYGLWTSPKGPILHAGDALGRWPFKDEDWIPISTALRMGGSGPVWRLAPPTPRPKKAAPVSIGQELRKKLDMWRFKPLGPGSLLTGADVIIGWDGMARLGACAPFRVHLLAIGGAGTGKTTLSRLMQAAGSANAGELLDSFTEAGLRTSISGEARALYLDEAEPSPDGPGPVERALEMLRRMSTGEGSNRVQAEKAGATMAQSAVGAAWLGAILSVSMGDALATRVVEVRLNKLGAAKGGEDDTLEAAIEWAREHSPGLLARAMRDAGRYRNDVSMMKQALGETGKTPRVADLTAALAAGRRLMLFDEPLTLEAARLELDLWAPLLDLREETASTTNPGQACLAKIFSLNSGQHYHDRHLSLGELIQTEAQTRGTYDKILKTWGLRVENGPAGTEMPGPWLWVSNNHPTLARALEKTDFRNWRAALDHLDDMGEGYAPKTLPHAPKFGMHQSRALAVPLTPWLDGPVGVGADPREATPFEAPVWKRPSPGSSRSSSPGESHD